MSNPHLFIQVIFSLILILGGTRLSGKLIMYVGQPRVVGEMITGIILGSIVFAYFFPSLQNQIFSTDVKNVLFVLGHIGVSIFMFLIGATLNTKKMRSKLFKQASMLAIFGTVPTFILGFLIGLYLYKDISIPNISSTNFSIFLGCALSITAFPVLAGILQEKGETQSYLGSLVLIASSINDVIAWCFFSLIVVMAQGDNMINTVYKAVGILLFTFLMLGVFKPLAKKYLLKKYKENIFSQSDLAKILIILLLIVWLTEYIGGFSIFGAFLTGVALPRIPAFQSELVNRLSDWNTVFFLPIFFVVSGVNVKVEELLSAYFLLPFLLILITAILGKYGFSLGVMKYMGFSWRDSSAVGGLMNARGLMELVLINLGLSYGIISQNVFSLLVFMTIVTTAMAAPIYTLSRASNNCSNKINESSKQNDID
ncbi:transporter [Bacillus thuringiensis]|nr:transporter [Bacillus toyonensis biovar Thuringiensis]